MDYLNLLMTGGKKMIDKLVFKISFVANFAFSVYALKMEANKK